MVSAKGYANCIAWVDLTNRAVEYREIDEDEAVKFIGGRGLGGRIVLKHSVGKDPLSPENVIAILNGPLTGTTVPMSGRIVAVARSPLTGVFGDTHAGGWAGATMKWAGFDAVVLSGASDKPVYLLVKNRTVSIEPADGLWGKSCEETYELLKKKYNGGVQFYGIGPAGENLVKFANIMHFAEGALGRASGRTGMGAVLGSKKVKGLVILGDEKDMPKPAKPEAYEKAREAALKKILLSAVTGPRKGGLSVYGTAVLVNVVNEIGAWPTRNAQDTKFEHAYYLSGENLRGTILKDTPTCHACPVACKRDSEVTDGKFKHKSEGPEFETIWALGAMTGLGHIEAVSYLNYLANLYGMDTIELGNTLAVAAEASKKGLIKEKVEWGDADKFVELVRRIAFREGELGNILAEGGAKAARMLGDPDISMSVKGMSIPAYDPRGLKGFAVAYSTSPRGACHLRAYTPASEILGIPYKTDPLATEGKVDLVILLERLFAFADSLDMCKFSSFALGLEDYAALFSTFTGIDMTPEELLNTGERILTQERYFNQLHGLSRKDDKLPKRFMEVASPSGPSKGHVIDEATFNSLIDEYYRKHGWNMDGTIPQERLIQLAIA
ncbi:MAG: aldehyde ferredoxin oxidoreductase family protein [Candidatus Caldarchaeum sp.]|nr:aldehyde ferredoxin oxidoreductase family protein [Candidatus Caldarchaeum sp.]MCX8200753.1 aldehyde ferredoxin oxidoreductase family protein [Candidatus Caldarchaeum sp.]MDW8435602.1 aldehyde ferredoxin oxidoreductase family protein [Candidatus Caldarchaeum sp.]